MDLSYLLKEAIRAKDIDTAFVEMSLSRFSYLRHNETVTFIINYLKSYPNRAAVILDTADEDNYCHDDHYRRDRAEGGRERQCEETAFGIEKQGDSVPVFLWSFRLGFMDPSMISAPSCTSIFSGKVINRISVSDPQLF